MRDWRPGLINKGYLALSISKINSLDKTWVPTALQQKGLLENEFAVTCQPSDLILKMCPWGLLGASQAFIRFSGLGTEVRDLL